ncbi:MAG: peroxidase-related enzyme [Thermodesulfobacteriota bacterium]
MPRIKPIETEDASEEVQEVFVDIEAAFGMVPNLFKTAAHFPPLLRANWNKVKAVMFEGVLSRKTKEAIAVVVSKDNSCGYCVAAHVGMLEAIGIEPDEVARIENDVERADFTEKELALIVFARKANSDPNRVSDEEFELVRAAGGTNAEIVEALGVMEVFTAFNKFLDSLAVELDF